MYVCGWPFRPALILSAIEHFEIASVELFFLFSMVDHIVIYGISVMLHFAWFKSNCLPQTRSIGIATWTAGNLTGV
jgi:hypothetical protein